MWSNGEVTLIDWDNAAAAPSARDVQRVLQVLGPEAEGAFSVSYGRRPSDRVDGPVHEVLFLADLLRAACADQSAARDLQRVEQQVARTIDALRAIGA
jgi:thiamine kinase-like enzyme